MIDEWLYKNSPEHVTINRKKVQWEYPLADKDVVFRT